MHTYLGEVVYNQTTKSCSNFTKDFNDDENHSWV